MKIENFDIEELKRNSETNRLIGINISVTSNYLKET